MFKLGDYVEWIEAARGPLSGNAVGKIVAIIPSDTGRADFNLYDVEFSFGRRTLHGTQLSLKESAGPDNPLS